MNRQTVIVSGVGYRDTAPTESELPLFHNPSTKVNIGAAVARRLAEDGFDLILLSRTAEKILRVACALQEEFPHNRIEGRVVDMLDARQVEAFASTLESTHLSAYVHSAGLSTGSYALKDDNPYLPVEEIPADLPTIEFDTVVRSLLLMVRSLLPALQLHARSRVVVVGSMSGIRPYPLGYSHASAKAGLHAAVRALALELSPRGVLLSEVLPGIVDTGLYDNPVVQAAVRRIGASFGRIYEEIPQMRPSEVAEAVSLCLRTTGHVLSVTMVADGQWPHEGA